MAKRTPRISASKANLRKISWLVIGLAALAALVFAVAIVSSQPRRLTEEETTFLHRYEQVRAALARDDLEGAKVASANLAARAGNVQKFAADLAGSDTLNSARQAFKAISHMAVELARKQPQYYVVECTMPCPEKCLKCPMGQFGRWVQVSPEVSNPYMGLEKPHCGRLSR